MSDLNDTQLGELKAAFNEMDMNNDGVISADEIEILLLKLGLEVPVVLLDSVIEEIDQDKDGTINFDEFVDVMENIKEQVFTDLRITFGKIDSDGDGYINHDELKKMMLEIGQDLSDDEISEMITTADLDNDNKVSFDEFVNMMS